MPKPWPIWSPDKEEQQPQSNRLPLRIEGPPPGWLEREKEKQEEKQEAPVIERGVWIIEMRAAFRAN